MKKILLFSVFVSKILFAQKAQIWLTKTDKSKLFEKQNKELIFQKKQINIPTIFVNEDQKFQKMDGFGYTLTSGSASLINPLSAKKELLNELFAIDKNNIGISYLRISIGASDLSAYEYSYSNEKDLSLKNFTLKEDEKDLIPVLKEILKINPQIKILSSPWSPPKWMKTNESSKGGLLKPEYFQVYANYLAKYIKEMAKHGIKIAAITIQNEPLHPDNNPSLLMEAEDQGNFIKNYLGPTFLKQNIKTKIIIYDHNADRPDYPIHILNDPAPGDIFMEQPFIYTVVM